MLGDELIGRLVCVEAVNNVVANPPRPGAMPVVLKTLGFGVANHIEPMLRPSFAIVRAGQQPIDELLVSIGRWVGFEGCNFVGRRRQAEQVVGQAADQYAAISSGRWAEFGLLQAS